MLGLDARIVGVDYSERAISFAKAFNPGIEFFVQDLTLLDLPYRFDQIILNEVIEHIPPEMLPEIIRRIAAHLKDEGMLVVSVPSANKPVSAKHYQHFTPESLEKTLRPYFSITSLECYGRSGKEKRLSLLKKIVMVSFPFRKKIAPVRKLVEYLPKYYEKNMAHAGPKDCKGLIAVCRKNK
jgi:SAM-dependent methyltransferase